MKRPNKRILICCEGFTEYKYAIALRNELPRASQRSLSIEINQYDGGDTLSLAKKAVRLKKKAKREGNPYSDIWLFFDNDNCPKIKNTFDIINAHSFKIAYSSICIEHWFLLHFEHCGKAFGSCDEVIKQLKNHWSDYDKSKRYSIKHYDELKAKMDQAKSRAKSLRRTGDISSKIYDRNPLFTIDKFIDYFNALK